MLKTPPFRIFRDRGCVTIHVLLSIRSMWNFATIWGRYRSDINPYPAQCSPIFLASGPICLYERATQNTKSCLSIRNPRWFLRTLIQCKFNAKWGWLWICTTTGGKHGLFTCFSVTDFYVNLTSGFKTKLGPSERQNDPKKILTECLLTQSAEFHIQLSSKALRRNRLYFEFKKKFWS